VISPDRNLRVQAFVQHFGGRYRAPDVIMRHLVRAELRRAHLAQTPEPIDPSQLHSRFRISEVRITREFAFAGILTEEAHAYIIHIKAASRGRMRFTHFHELAHVYFIEATDAVLPHLPRAERNRISQEEERLCDIAASEFLLPHKVFFAAARDATTSWSGLRRLAEQFDASLDATLHRLSDGFVGPLLVTRWSRVEHGYRHETLVATGALQHLRQKPQTIATAPPYIAAAFATHDDCEFPTHVFVDGAFRTAVVAMLRQQRGATSAVLTLTRLVE